MNKLSHHLSKLILALFCCILSSHSIGQTVTLTLDESENRFSRGNDALATDTRLQIVGGSAVQIQIKDPGTKEGLASLVKNTKITVSNLTDSHIQDFSLNPNSSGITSFLIQAGSTYRIVASYEDPQDHPVETSVEITTVANTEPVEIYTGLTVGFAFTPAQHHNYNAVIGKDSSGNQNIQLQDNPSTETVSTGLAGAVSIAFDLHPGSLQKVSWLDIHAVGLTFGSGIANSTSGTIDLAPFVGATLFFGDTNNVGLTFGVQWVPQSIPILPLTASGAVPTNNVYRGGKFFVGLSYRI